MIVVEKKKILRQVIELKKFFATFFATLILFFQTCAANSVQVIGQGSTQRMAIHNAMRSAIEKELGTNIGGKTLVKNNRVVLDEISANSNGFISGYEIISEREENGIFFAELKVEVDSELLKQTLSQKKFLINLNADNPRIAVLAYDAAGKNYPEVENEIFFALQRQGFTRTIDLAQINSVTQKKISAAENDPALRKMLANDFHIDYLVLTEVKISEKNYLLASRLISVNTGKIIHADNSSGNVGMFTASAGSVTLKLAARRAGFSISNAALKSAAKVEQHITLLVTDSTFKKIGGTLTSANNFVKNLDGVNDAFVRNMQGAIELDVNFDGTANDFASQLELVGFKILEVASDFVKI